MAINISYTILYTVYISIITALVVAAVGMLVGIPSTTFASDINCEEEPNDEYCTGEEGAAEWHSVM
jgi:hypothetical protein